MKRSNFENALLYKSVPPPKREVSPFTRKDIKQKWMEQEGLTQEAVNLAESLHGDLKTKNGADKAMASLGKFFDKAAKDKAHRQAMKDQLERFRELKDDKLDKIIACSFRP